MASPWCISSWEKSIILLGWGMKNQYGSHASSMMHHFIYKMIDWGYTPMHLSIREIDHSFGVMHHSFAMIDHLINQVMHECNTFYYTKARVTFFIVFQKNKKHNLFKSSYGFVKKKRLIINALLWWCLFLLEIIVNVILNLLKGW